jgi:solute carrier family 25 (mitochondrial S-adenosylmethionine transporter), member 26
MFYWDALAGGVAGAFTEIIFYAIDSAKVQTQAGEKLTISRLYRGAVPIAFSGSFPSIGVFFGVFTPAKEFLCGQNTYSGSGVLAASVIAAIPSSLAGVPADVLKKRLVLGMEQSMAEAFAAVIKKDGFRGLFLGWRTNMIKDIPFAGLKLSLYEGISEFYLKTMRPQDEIPSLRPFEAAGVGLVSGTMTSILTCPIDCVNTRIKSGELAEYGVIAAHREILKRNGVRALFRGLVPRTIVLSLGSTVFWFLYARLQHLGDVFDEDRTSTTS